MNEKDCIFCKIASGEISSHKIYENKETIAFLDLSNDFIGHTLVISKTHSANILSISKQEAANCMQTIKKVCNNYLTNGFDGFNIVVNCNEAGGQTMMHTHYHIIPRKNNDKISILSVNKVERNLKEELELLKIK